MLEGACSRQRLDHITADLEQGTLKGYSELLLPECPTFLQPGNKPGRLFQGQMLTVSLGFDILDVCFSIFQNSQLCVSLTHLNALLPSRERNDYSLTGAPETVNWELTVGSGVIIYH